MTETQTVTIDHPTEKQASFLASLLASRTGYTPEFKVRVEEALAGTRSMTKKEASATIDWLLDRPKAPKAGSGAGGSKVSVVDEGLYQTDEGLIWKVYKTQNDRPAGKVLVVTETTDGWAGRFEYVKGGQYTISKAVAAGTAHVLTEDEAKEFGKQYAFCVNCSIHLTEDRSIAAGFGPTCAGHRGWHYPTKAEAAEILGRPVL